MVTLAGIAFLLVVRQLLLAIRLVIGAAPLAVVLGDAVLAPLVVRSPHLNLRGASGAGEDPHLTHWRLLVGGVGGRYRAAAPSGRRWLGGPPRRSRRGGARRSART